MGEAPKTLVDLSWRLSSPVCDEEKKRGFKNEQGKGGVGNEGDAE